MQWAKQESKEIAGKKKRKLQVPRKRRLYDGGQAGCGRTRKEKQNFDCVANHNKKRMDRKCHREKNYESLKPCEHLEFTKLYLEIDVATVKSKNKFSTPIRLLHYKSGSASKEKKKSSSLLPAQKKIDPHYLDKIAGLSTAKLITASIPTTTITLPSRQLFFLDGLYNCSRHSPPAYLRFATLTAQTTIVAIPI